jgi:hypothetical protein
VKPRLQFHITFADYERGVVRAGAWCGSNFGYYLVVVIGNIKENENATEEKLKR